MSGYQEPTADPTDAPEAGLFSVPPDLRADETPANFPELELTEPEVAVPVESSSGVASIGDAMMEIMRLAHARGASDVHLTVGKPPAFRINGAIEFLDKEPYEAVTLGRMLFGMITPIQRERFTKAHQLCFAREIEGVGFTRFNFYSQMGNPEVSIRLGRSNVPTYRELGVPEVMSELVRGSGGLILVTGPTGVGKTSTLNAIIGRLNQTERKKIITIEDPIEFIHPAGRSILVQQEIGVDAESFDQAVTHCMRQDPDIIVLGEMVDLGTIASALTAAETGHMVMGTLHTQGAAGTITRIIDVFPPNQQAQIRNQLTNNLRAVISQKLLPRANGNGRMMVFELLVVNDAVRTLIREDKIRQIANVMQTGRSQGMQLMDHMIRDAWMSGDISYETAVASVSDAKVLSRRR